MNQQIRLTTSALLERQHEFLTVDEAIVTLCMNPLYMPTLDDEVELDDPSNQDLGTVVKSEFDSMSAAILRTGAIFVLDHHEVEPALQSAWEGHAPIDQMSLPPLPFPRIIIEGRCGDDPNALLRIYAEDYPDEDFFHVQAILISEHMRGECWDVAFVSEFPDESTQATRVRLRADAEQGLLIEDAFVGSEYWEEDDVFSELERHPGFGDAVDRGNHRLIALAVTCAHLITAERAPRREWTVPRAQRREMKRKYRATLARIYFVDLKDSGEIRRGNGDREYHVRWLVCGHWRLNESGSTFVPHKRGMCSWVKPYIKGPAGAPWKGRPVYRGPAQVHAGHLAVS